MKRSILTISMLAALSSSVALHAQEQGQEQPAADECSICEFDVGDEIVGNVAEYSESLRNSDTPLRTYTQDSIGGIERAAASALTLFRAWYVHRVNQDNAEALANRQIAEIVGQGLSAGMNLLLPGSGTVVSKIRQYSQAAYSYAVSQAPSGTTNPEPYLQSLETRLTNNNTRLLNLMNELFHGNELELREQMQMIRMEYVGEQLELQADGSDLANRQSPGPSTRQLLNQVGIPEPIDAHFNRVRLETLTNMINRVICQSINSQRFSLGNCRSHPSMFQTIARSVALRLIVTNGSVSTMNNLTNQGHLNTVCAVENRLSYTWMSQDCRAWRDARR